MLLHNLTMFLGGLSVFILGVRLLCKNVEKLLADKIKRLFDSFGNRRIPAFLVGTGISMLTQSSVAVNSALVSLVDVGSITLVNACAVIVGVNVGTTITTQLLSLSGRGFIVLGIACITSFFGVVMSAFKRWDKWGEMLVGFGFIFIGLQIISVATDFFKQTEWFCALFECQSPFILLLYGILIPAVMQSSSALTGVMIVLAECGVISFSQCAYLILGANIGSCVGVVFSAMGKSQGAKRCANFNLLINVLGAVVFFPIVYFFPGTVQTLVCKLSLRAERQIADFHTIYNIITAVAVLPTLDFCVKLTDFKKIRFVQGFKRIKKA